MKIRAADTLDNDAVWRMLEPVFRAGDTYAIDPDISRKDALRYWMECNAYIAEADGVALGTFYIRPNQRGGGSHICNCGYIAARGAEGRGIGRAMLAFSLEEAKRLGFEAMQYNFVLADNLRAIAIWKKAGFAVIGRIPRAFKHLDGTYVDALVMHMFLS